ncbi:hypothetical protein PENTCL1PPCAC_14775, partial [Pristionchus entomophagus]
QERLRHRMIIELPPGGFSFPSTYKQWLIVDLVYAIEWLKTLAFFSRLRECEKIKLVRNVSQSIAYLTAAFDSYEQRRSDVTIMPDGTMLCQGRYIRNGWVEHDKWFGIIARLKALKVDQKEYVLIKAIIACDPDDAIFCAESREVLQNQREQFSKSLFSYVLASRGTEKGPYAYSQMISLVIWQKHSIRKLKNMYLLLTELKIFSGKAFNCKFLDDVNSV